MDWIPTTPEEIPQLFVRAWNERKPEKIADLFFDQAEFVNVVGMWWHTKEEIFKAHKYGLEVIFKDSTLKLMTCKVKTVTDDVAIIHAKMKLSSQTSPETSPDGLQDRRTIFSFVARKTKNGWLCLSAQNTDIVPGAETNIVDEKGLKGISYR